MGPTPPVGDLVEGNCVRFSARIRVRKICSFTELEALAPVNALTGEIARVHWLFADADTAVANITSEMLLRFNRERYSCLAVCLAVWLRE